jgi:hypothetical protein
VRSCGCHIAPAIQLIELAQHLQQQVAVIIGIDFDDAANLAGRDCEL